MGPRYWVAKLHQRQQDERGAEMIEFAVVIVLLLLVVYGMVAVGLSLGARETINQAVADGARSGIVQPLDSSGKVTTSTETSVNNRVVKELGWLGLGTCGGGKVQCYTDGGSTCPSSFSSLATSGDMCVSATSAGCASSADPNICLTVAVNYYYTSAPIFPLAPGFNLITPSDIASSATMQVSTPT